MDLIHLLSLTSGEALLLIISMLTYVFVSKLLIAADACTNILVPLMVVTVMVIVWEVSVVVIVLRR